MVFTAHAKVNITLAVLGTRADGYHLLDMLMQSVQLGDSLTFAPAGDLRLALHGMPPIPSDGRNLALRAAQLLQDTYHVTKGACITLKKRIPVGAGLGGGSADAAAVLLGLDRLWDLRLPYEELAALGLALGADVPFCLSGGLARVQGVGDIIQPIPCEHAYDLLIVQPCVGLSTPAVFKAYDALPGVPRNPDAPAAEKAMREGDLRALAMAMGNALEAAAIPMRPEIAICIQTLSHYGAIAVQMTGSGSAVIALFDSMDDAARAYRSVRRIWAKCYQTRTSVCGVSMTSDIK